MFAVLIRFTPNTMQEVCQTRKMAEFCGF